MRWRSCIIERASTVGEKACISSTSRSSLVCAASLYLSPQLVQDPLRLPSSERDELLPGRHEGGDARVEIRAQRLPQLQPERRGDDPVGDRQVPGRISGTHGAGELVEQLALDPEGHDANQEPLARRGARGTQLARWSGSREQAIDVEQALEGWIPVGRPEAYAVRGGHRAEVEPHDVREVVRVLELARVGEGLQAHRVGEGAVRERRVGDLEQS